MDSEGRDKYVMMKELVDLVIKNDGEVYGGYVRDFILHEYKSTQFFKENKTATSVEFNDKTFSPHTLDRLLVPNDIDVHFKKFSDYRKFRLALRPKCFKARTIKNNNSYTVRQMTLDIHASFTPKDLGEVSSLIRNRFSPVELPFSVKMDVNISATENPPYNDLDFECNGLVMNSRGVELCQNLSSQYNYEGRFRTLMRIIEDTRSKIARVVTLKGSRWDKMSDRPGWTLIGLNIEKHPIEGTECLLCHEDVGSDEAYKFSCCSATYHLDCMVDIIRIGPLSVYKTHRCPHCRKSLVIGHDEHKVFCEMGV
mgnify:CR=1 FL=1